MLTHTLEHGVLVITVGRDPGIDGRAALSTQMAHLIEAHAPTPVVVDLTDRAASIATVSAVLRAHQLCGRQGVTMSVVTQSARLRRLLENDADTACSRLTLHTRRDAAVAACFTPAA
ncbi:hypothetical protein TU94_32425 [Streptomyces cyaneogriseus subsp. noncyanogenus]|jgi:hypothetical protein|uniref:STAS domain-containing protein n=1 Tax=Streptomyces cyaneogriseus subsp. noncyanogenus TaxID=477245 RepID=A0A0C5GLP4_9ACTN|nr:hypothetical protein [Streptomyces cyaneogriseus]AJP05411.1 hypothetical protein TU94_32425 [Streptomyces cyaneogriseus subsp. noncyanogenus]